MSAGDDVEELLESPSLADALESNRFRQFLDHVPFAVVVAELHPEERITYANPEYERLTGQTTTEIDGRNWQALAGDTIVATDGRRLSEAVLHEEDYLGIFIVPSSTPLSIDAWCHIILDNDGKAVFRLVALARTNAGGGASGDLMQQLREKDTLLRELQHRVKNNLQMITALIRLEARNRSDEESELAFERLAGRINALALLYNALAGEDHGDSVDLGAYLSQVASAVMQAHAVEGIRLDLMVDAWPVSINVAMPAGLVVNELLTNALKHAFPGREHGTITLHSLVDATGCRVLVADDGVGLPAGTTWPQPGKMSALIVQSLEQNADARVAVDPGTGSGVRVSIFFARAKAAPEAA
ncbi:MAG TPA: histidine kinase dimerization/phosphoacceptor domain -containing protein [Devosiaceae bacterium]|nr:histidine kinase dimerization/phosphoacceptor domain -containing protein [Devosiaceae bacterium]